MMLFQTAVFVYRRPLTCNDTGEIRWNHITFYEYPLGICSNFHPELVQGVAGPKEQSGNVPGHDLFGDMGRRGVLVLAEWVKDEGIGMEEGWLVDGCWLSFWLEIACCRKKIPHCVLLWLFGQSYYACFFGEKCHQRKDLCFRSFGFFVGGSIEKIKQSIHKLELMVRPT